MREFQYFLFENFDADQESSNPMNPRRFLGPETDPILTEVVQVPVGTCSYAECCEQYGTHLVQKLTEGGVLRAKGDALLLDCPIFLREDASVLRTEIASKASALVDMLQICMPEIQECCAKIDNGFPAELNLYHILCGMVFDGSLFEHLSDHGALATSRQHPSGLDYLTVIYEKCDELQALSDGLLCSYNRLVNEKCSLQSFGDARGNRFDFYRFFRLWEQGHIPEQFKPAQALLMDRFGDANKDKLLDEVIALAQTRRCDPAVAALLEMFAYTEYGAFCVPVYTAEHRKWIDKIERIVEKNLGDVLSQVLMELAESIDITAVRHGVSRLEISNELYHIVFGSINEELVARGFAAAPDDLQGEGRYFKCVEIY